MGSDDTFVIIGAGLAGGKAAAALREEGFEGSVIVIGAEREYPYERPPLSKGFLLGNDERDSVFLHPEQWYADNAIEVRPGVRAQRIDPAAHTVTLDTGDTLSYTKLLIATGSAPRRLAVPGADLSGIYYLRTLADSEALRTKLEAGVRNVVIIGGGWIGLETAAAAVKFGNSVTIIEQQPTVLNAVLGRQLGEYFGELHRAHGVTLLTGTGVAEVAGDDGHVRAVITDSGQRVDADLVIAGIGIVPESGLAEQAGLEAGNGISVSASLRTSDPDIYAAGDVADAYNPLLGRSIRVEHWANAVHGGPAAAKAMLGQPVSFDRIPYFYSDQYDMGMEYSGFATGADETVIRGDLASGAFVAYWLRDGVIAAGMNVNVWDVNDRVQELIRARAGADQIPD